MRVSAVNAVIPRIIQANEERPHKNHYHTMNTSLLHCIILYIYMQKYNFNCKY